MAYFEILRGLKKLEFERLPAPNDDAACAVVEFVYDVPLPPDQWARIALGRHNGVLRELVGIPELVASHNTKTSKPEYLYRLRGPIAAGRD